LIEHQIILKYFKKYILTDIEKVSDKPNWSNGNLHRLIVKHLEEYKEKHSRFFKLNDILHEIN